MKVAISATGKDLNCQMDPRFGRCQYFIFIDPESWSSSFRERGLMASGALASGSTTGSPKGAKAHPVISGLMRPQPSLRGSKSISAGGS
jgi:predicted Fe-Mo cluster-binding NifX family protein